MSGLQQFPLVGLRKEGALAKYGHVPTWCGAGNGRRSCLDTDAYQSSHWPRVLGLLSGAETDLARIDVNRDQQIAVRLDTRSISECGWLSNPSLCRKRHSVLDKFVDSFRLHRAQCGVPPLSSAFVPLRCKVPVHDAIRCHTEPHCHNACSPACGGNCVAAAQETA